MEKFYTIGETAKLANVTTETLRHYDRIGLISPCKTDEWTGYRYYSERELLPQYCTRTAPHGLFPAGDQGDP